MTDYTKLVERAEPFMQGLGKAILREIAASFEALQGDLAVEIELRGKAERGLVDWCVKHMNLEAERDALQSKLDELQRQEPVAWFAFGESNGPVPLELFGWDEKACKHAVLTNARSVGWKGTLDGYLYEQGWTIKPVYTHAAPKALGPLTDEQIEALVDIAYKHWQNQHIFDIDVVRADFRANGITKGTP